MDFRQDASPHPYRITHYDANSVTVKGVIYTESLIISHTTILPDWSARTVETLTEAAFTAFLPLACDLILLGTGPTHAFLPKETLAWFPQHHLAVEIMSTPAAIRTFNTLLTEGRNVAVGLLLG